MTLQLIANINLNSLLDSSLSLLLAFICGGLIGLERQLRQRTAGLRTNILVAVGAAIFVDMGNRLGGAEAAVHVVAYVVSGIGFLGAGVIMREEGNVRGLNTAATLWGSAAVGACAGADLLLEALVGTLFVLLTNTALRPIVHHINRRPVNPLHVESCNTIYIICPKQHQKATLALFEQLLAQARVPVQQMHLHPFGTDSIQIEAILFHHVVSDEQLDQILSQLQGSPLIAQAFWSANLQA